MRIYRLVSAALSGVLMAGVGASALAGGYNACGGPNCSAGVTIHPSQAGALAPVGMYAPQPYGHLKTVEYKNTPNVNIMRVHSNSPQVSLGDHPSRFTSGCMPSSTTYCRSGGGQQMNVQLSAAPVAPVYNPAPIAMPVHIAPPAPQIRIASGFNAANYASRQYGSADFVPGIAHVPTSYVDRSPITHIDGVPQARAHSVTTASGYSQSSSTVSVQGVTPQTVQGGNLIGQVVAGQYTYQPPGGGAYWEKTSGPSIVDGLPSTQILCRREAPRPAPVTVKVVRNVYGVPQPVPTPYPVPVQTGCAPAPMAMHGAQLAGPPRTHMGSRYGQSSAWTY